MKYAILALAVTLAGCNGGQRDDSDPPNNRSGINIYIDNLTGCQYLSVGSKLDGHAITPRISADGKQICRKGEK